ncbi:hypothetical protein BDV12DRAFT_204472 [Aspergillus spectabilis]
MPPPLRALEHGDLYTVGLITALPLERAAATAMLDEKHEKPFDFTQPRSDANPYTWGRIGEHNVVIAPLAEGKYGTTSAAATASPMLASFPQIRIGTGISRPYRGHDIRLADVAVSQPGGNSGSDIQGLGLTGVCRAKILDVSKYLVKYEQVVAVKCRWHDH